MTRMKSSNFFTNHLECFRKAENYFEAEYEKKENKLRRELAEHKELRSELVIYKDREIQLNSELDALKNRENKTKEDFQKLKEELIIYKDGERQLKDNKEKLHREVEQLKDNEKQLQSNLTEAKGKEAFLTKLQSECNMIKREKEVQVKEKELHEKERELDRRVKELYERLQNLAGRLKQLEIRERELTQGDGRSCEHHQPTADTHSVVSGEKNRPLDECEGELESREHSQAAESHGIHKPVRRNSKELEPPNMSESGPLHTL